MLKQTYDCVLITLDGSVEAERALPYALEAARAFHARLLLVRVLGERYDLAMVAAGQGILASGASRILAAEAGEVEKANTYLRQIAERLGTSGVTVSCLVMEGPEYEVIARAVSPGEATLIVTAVARPGRITEAFIHESRAERLAIKTHRPILVIPRAPN